MNHLPFGSNFPFGASPLYKDDVVNPGNQVFLSIGTAGDYKTIDNYNGKLFVYIHDHIAKFSFPQTNINVGIGDKVTCGTTVFYLSYKIDMSKWYVTNNLGQDLDDLTYIQVDSITKVFNTLSEAIHGGSPGLYNVVGTYDLSAMDIQPNLVCYNISETNDIDIQEIWTLNDNRSLRIFTPHNFATECNQCQRHSGLIGNGYTLQSTSPTNSALVIFQRGVIIDGLQITGALNGVVTLAGNTIISNNLIANCASSGIYNFNHDANISPNYIISNIVANCTEFGIQVGSTTNPSDEKITYLYNNTVVNCGTGMKIRSPATSPFYTSYVKNNLCQNNTLDYSFSD